MNQITPHFSVCTCLKSAVRNHHINCGAGQKCRFHLVIVLISEDVVLSTGDGRTQTIHESILGNLVVLPGTA